MPLQIDIEAVLERLAVMFDIPNERGRDAALVRALELNSNTVLGNWKRRNSLDFDTIIPKCRERDVSLDWILFGVGPMRVADAPGLTVYQNHGQLPITDEPPLLTREDAIARYRQIIAEEDTATARMERKIDTILQEIVELKEAVKK